MPESSPPRNSEDDTPDIQLFKSQKRIFPKQVDGFFRKLKWVVMVVTLGIYYFVPFIRWDRGLNAPDQAVLIDLENKRAYWFFIEIWPQEIYLLTGILVLAAIALFFVTSMFGRVWCGYFCFQTVWTDLFIWVERLVQGDRYARQKLHEQKWNLEKLAKMVATHFLWLAISFCTGGAFVLYFNDAPTLIQHALEFDVSTSIATVVLGLTFSTYLMAGFAREQVCTYMCPYARFQAAMFDENTLIIGYDMRRGEPRGKHKKGDEWKDKGHCIDCTACVQVCPMGIDIRDGLQMECIACGLCIDACDNIMDRLSLPHGLIRYDTARHIKEASEGVKAGFHILRARTLYYAAIMALVGGVMLYALVSRAPFELHVLHDRNPLFVQLSDGTVRNGYEIKILNKTHDDKVFKLQFSGLERYEIAIKTAGEVSADRLEVGADNVGSYHVFVSSKLTQGAPRDIVFTLTDSKTGDVDTYESVFMSRRGE